MSHKGKIVRYRALEDRRSGILLYLLCFFAYVITYIGRLNWSAAMAAMISDGRMSKEAVGIIATAFYACYGGGQFVNGYLGDHVSPFFLIGFGVTASGVMNFAMGTAINAGAPFAVLLVLWALNGYTQSSIWSPLIRIISTVLPDEQRGPACSNMLISTALGTLSSYILSTLLIKYSGYDHVFTIPGVILIIGGIIWFSATAPVVRRTKQYVEARLEKAQNRESGTHSFNFLFIRSGILLMLIPSAMMALMKDGITTWTPTAITEIFGSNASFAVFVTSLLPLANVLGAAMSHIVIERLFHNAMTASAVFFAAATLLEVMLFIFGRTSIAAMIIIMALTSAVLVADSNIFVTFVPAAFGQYRCVSTMTGLTNATANLFNSLSSLIVGNVTSGSGGWDAAILMWIAFGVVGTVSSLLIIRRWGRFNNIK